MSPEVAGLIACFSVNFTILKCVPAIVWPIFRYWVGSFRSTELISNVCVVGFQEEKSKRNRSTANDFNRSFTMEGGREFPSVGFVWPVHSSRLLKPSPSG